MRTCVLILFICGCPGIFTAQDETRMETLPYAEIPDYPDDYTPGNVIARAVDGLGYRYYWATEKLRQEDLDYRPSEDSRTTKQTLDHLLGLSRTIANACASKPNIRPAPSEELSWDEMREQTLLNFKKASELLKGNSAKDLESHKIIFQRGDRKAEYPFWNLINGPIADALYHTGQVVAFRRASGNPLDPRVNVFSGKNRE